MAVSKVQICNNALAKLGASQITDLTDDSQEARLCSLFYDQVRDDLISSHLWNFAIKRQTLSQLVTTPDFDFAYEYQLPLDCLRVIRMKNDSSYPFRIEGRKLLTDTTSAQIVYIASIDDPTQYPAFFSELFAIRLAMEMAYSLAGNVSLYQMLYKLYDDKLREAKKFDSQEGTPLDFEANTWIDSRR